MDYLFSPIVITLLIITVISVVVGIRQAKSIMSEGESQSGSKRAPMIFLLVVIAYLGVAVFDASRIPDINMTDKIVPLVIGSISLLCCLILLVQMMRAPEGDVLFADREIAGEDANATYGLWPTLAWFGFLVLLTGLVGFILALVVFLLSFLTLRAGASWQRTLLLTVCGIAFMCFMASTLNRDFPPGLLQSYVDLPWPLR